MIRALVLLLLPFAAQADSIRVATYNTELRRDGPGLLLRDIQRGDPQVLAVVDVIASVNPDVVALQSIDWDLDGLALSALVQALSEAGVDYPYWFSEQPNSGMETHLDLDGNGKTNDPADAQGWGRFTGHNGLAVLSRYPIMTQSVVSYSKLLWRDLPGAELPKFDETPFPSAEAHSIQRLSSTAHWVIPIDLPGERLNLMTFHATPPVFDGPEDRNGLRNRDEIRLWQLLMDGELGPAPKDRFIIAGDANLDATQGEGLNAAIRSLLSDPRVQDTKPRDENGATTTVSWKGVGDRRVDYVLPSADWSVVGSGVYWPNHPLNDAAAMASRHRLVWVDLDVE
ncbi:MAG: endonuclease/exonuclease/phosphatase family protein [Ruegeria sp.]